MPVADRELVADRAALVAYARRIGASPDDAEDAAQDAIIGVYISGVSPTDRGRYLRAAVRRSLIPRSRHRQTVTLDRAEAIPDPGDAPDGELYTQLIARLIATLPGSCAPVLLLAAQGYGAAEIAKMLGVSSAAARTRLYRGRRRLAQLLMIADRYINDRLTD